MMLEKLKVAETPKWSVIFDYPAKMVYFKTRLHPEIKSFSMKRTDFSNTAPTQILNIDILHGGDVSGQLHRYNDDEVVEFLMDLPLPDEFFTVGGLTREEFCDRAARHWHAAERSEIQSFAGTWIEIETEPGKPTADERWVMTMVSAGNRVKGEISRVSSAVENAPMDHLRMVGNRLVFTFRESVGGEIFEVRAEVEGDRIEAHLYGTEDDYGGMTLTRSN
jgi:hypothetical protein